jgi:predicted GH43/DUF377 family glycosyl hydrolase
MKKIYLLSLLAIFSLNLYCQVHWIKHHENPIMVPGSSGDWDSLYVSTGPVIYYDTLYHMWYTGGMDEDTARIGHATSPDGITWTKDTNNPVLDVGPDGDWDESSVFSGGALVIDSVFHLWYTGHFSLVNNAAFRIGHATSPDGITWTKDTNNPVLDVGPTGTWDDTWVEAGSVVYDGNIYHMWYEAWTGTDNQVRIGHATSTDGVTWAKDPANPVLSFGKPASWDYPRVDFPAVVFDGTTYHMWYSGGDWFNWQIGYATSEDGSSWTKYTNNPVLPKGPDGSWDADRVFLSSVIDSSGVKYKMWYTGVKGQNGGIGYAESDPFVDIPDTAFLHALIDEGVDTNEDSLISYTEAMAIISLEISGNGISDMTGIEAFVYLDTLDCSNNSLTTLDVSNNTALKDLNVSSNELASLDVSSNPLLEWLTCSSNELTSLDVSNNPSLIGLYIQGNQIGSLNVSGVTALKFLRCRANLLTSLDVSNNNSLKGLSIDEMPTLFEVCVWVLPFPPEGVEIDTTGSPNVCFETDCNGTCSTTGINTNSPTGLSIYPNPTNNILTIETNRSGKHTVEIASLNGQLLFTDKIEGPSHQIDLSSFEKGLYFITVRSRDYVRTEKIIKQ